MNQAKIMIEDGFLDFAKIVETRRAFYASETDLIHKCKDGSFVYEENWFDWDDEQGKAYNFRQLSETLPDAWEKALPMEDGYWEDHNDVNIKEYSEDYFESDSDEEFYGFEKEYV